MIDYSPLWETMKKKNISQYQLLKRGIDNKTLDALKHNRNITVLTLEKICIICDCTPNEVLRFVKDPDPDETQTKTNTTPNIKPDIHPKTKPKIE